MGMGSHHHPPPVSAQNSNCQISLTYHAAVNFKVSVAWFCNQVFVKLSTQNSFLTIQISKLV